MTPMVSIIIPCRNEEKLIGKCLDSLINQDFPKEKMEVLVIDGMSEDKTREIVKKYTEKYQFIKLFDNPKKIAPAGQNLGLKIAQGEIIIILDAHSIYRKDYISKSLEYLKKYDADCVGGVIVTLPRENTLLGKAIAFALSHPFGAGNAYFRTGSRKPRWTDSVPFACYKRQVFEKVGNFNEKLVSSYDRDFNLRLKKIGGKILLHPDIVSYYYARSNLFDFLKHDFWNGIWVTYPLKFGIKIFSLRHLIPLGFVLGLFSLGILSLFFSLFLWLFLASVGIYFLLNIFSSFQIVKKEKDLRLFFLMPIIFFCHHFGYGLGSIFGIIKMIL
jgi:glycosyltransferase involved in cell wall biosynthesis